MMWAVVDVGLVVCFRDDDSSDEDEDETSSDETDDDRGSDRRLYTTKETVAAQW